jgi:hypothetical protein
LETKVQFLILGISMLLVGFIVLLFLAYLTPTLVNFGAFAFIIGMLVTSGSLVEIATDKKSLQLNKKRIISIALIVIAIGLAVPYSAWTIVVPNWSFSVSTDKSTYRLGKDVEITVTLRNMGFITHSFKSEVKVIYVSIRNRSTGIHVWYSSYHLQDMVFSLEPNQILQGNFLWNQTNIHQPEEEIEPGEYRIEARIPESDWDNYLFWAKTYINITST